MKYSYLKNMNWSMLRTAALQRLLAIVLLFSAVGAVVAQNPGDTLPVGLRVVSFEVNEDNYTGFDDGSERKLRNALKDLNDKLSPAAQSAFKAYDLGMYRVNDAGLGYTDSLIQQYHSTVKTNSTYYVLPVKIWSADNQHLDGFKVYLNLPESEIPVFSILTKTQLEEIATKFILDEFKARNNEITRVKESIAIGIRNFTDYLFKAIKFERITDDTIPYNLNFKPSDVTEDPCDGAVTFVLPTGDLLALPKTAQPFFIKCGQPRGALYQFKLNNQMYYNWRYFVNGVPQLTFIATQDPNDPTWPGTQYLPSCTTNPNSVYVLFPEGDKLQAYTVTIPNAKPYVQGSKKYEKESLFDLFLNKQPLNPTKTIVNTCKSRGYYPENSVINHKLPKGFVGTKATGPYVEGELPEIIDYTGRFSHLKNLVINDLDPDCWMDIVITDEETPSTIQQQLYELKPLTRGVLWIVLDYKNNEFYCKTILQESLVQKAGLDAGEIKARFWKMSEKLAKSIASDDLLVSYLGWNRYLYGLVSKVFKELKVSPKYYDATDPDYFLKNKNGIGAAIQYYVPFFKETIGVLCGIQHSLMDNLALVASIPRLLPEIVSIMLDEEYRKEMKTKADGIIKALKDEHTYPLVYNLVVGKIGSEYSTIRDSINTPKAGYYAGYVISEITIGVLTAGIFTGLKASITGSKSFVYACEIMRKIGGAIPYAQPLTFFVKGAYVITKIQVNGAIRYLIKINNAANATVLAQLDELGRLITTSIDQLLPKPTDFNPAYCMLAVTPEGTIYNVAIKSTGDGFFRMANELVEGLQKWILDNSGQSFSLATRVADNNNIGPNGGAWRLLDPEIVNALKSLDGNPPTGFTNRIKFLDDLLATTNPSSGGIGSKVGALTPQKILAWEGLLDAPDYVRRSFNNINEAEKLLDLSFTKADLKVLSGALTKLEKKNVSKSNIMDISERSLKYRHLTKQYTQYNIETDLFKQIDVLASSNLYSNPEGLTNLLGSMRTLSDNPGHLVALDEAVKLIKLGDEIAIEKVIIREDGTKVYYGDIANIAEKESIQLKAVISDKKSAVNQNLLRANNQFVSEVPPINYAKITQIKIMNPANIDYYGKNATELSSMLKELFDSSLQSQKSDFKNITEFRIENGVGHHKFKLRESNGNVVFDILN
jgi:hypothetical protein